MDTFESLNQHSPFAVNAICMVGARVMKGQGVFGRIPDTESYLLDIRTKQRTL